MTQLNEKKRDEAKSLLFDHQAITDALLNLGKSGFYTTLTVANEDDNDFSTVELQYAIAKKTFMDQKKWTETQLKKLGIEIV